MPNYSAANVAQKAKQRAQTVHFSYPCKRNGIRKHCSTGESKEEQKSEERPARAFHNTLALLSIRKILPGDTNGIR